MTNFNANDTVIISATRTPIGKFGGKLSTVPAPRLGATLVKSALQKLEIKGEQVDEIIMGNVLTAGVGQAPARQAALYGACLILYAPRPLGVCVEVD